MYCIVKKIAINFKRKRVSQIVVQNICDCLRNNLKKLQINWKPQIKNQSTPSYFMSIALTTQHTVVYMLLQHNKNSCIKYPIQMIIKLKMNINGTLRFQILLNYTHLLSIILVSIKIRRLIESLIQIN
ncbi:unnamed protein product [Paramecium sonneborni]|uniref:Uncharacterized protein n=1 Tax=Paramecium sonneborni TaxID=65129 RepID=A0A8S1KHD6_9CILI|nr:unnamed protein product [Paramecium sonneborni]